MTLERMVLSFLLLSLFPLVEPHGRRSLLSYEDEPRENGVGFVNWEERCTRNGGKKALNAWLSSQEDLVFCMMQNFDFGEIQNGFFDSDLSSSHKSHPKKKNNVFVKYCGAPMTRSLPCVQQFLDVSSQCLEEQDTGSLNVTMSMIEAAVKFLCHKRAKRIASFIHSHGMECLQDHLEPISFCINSTFPDILLMNNQKRFDLIVFNHRNCRQLDTIRHCIEKEMFKCPDPEPLRLLESFMSTLRRRTHCHRVSKYSLLSQGSANAYSGPPLLLGSALLALWKGTNSLL